MYGLIIKLRTHPGKRDEYIRSMSDGFKDMEECHSYIFAEDPEDPDIIWVTEIWESHEAHDRAINRTDVRAAINDVKARQLTIEREMRVVVTPVAGQGLFNDGAWRPEP
jgi:quinol monooxygenase YgiN